MPADVSNTTVVALSAGAGVSAWYLYRLWLQRSTPPTPPGPPPSFLVGNLRDLPKRDTCKVYTAWGKQYGELTFLSAFGRTLLIVNSFEAAVDLLDKRGHLYSDRPRMVMAGEMMGLDQGPAFSRHGPTWKKHRKYLKQALNARSTRQDYAPLQERKTYRYLQSLLTNPDNFLEDVHRLIGEVTTEIAYGIYKNEERDFVDLNLSLPMVDFKKVNGYLVELLPSLKHIPSWFPGAEFKREAIEYGKKYCGYRDYLFEDVKKRLATDPHAPPCYVTNALKEIAESGGDSDDEHIISASSFTFFRAGSDTTESGVKNMILAMVLHPELQARAQAEIDAVVGDRLPNVTDLDKLPFVNAITQEALRWNPPAPIAIPHRLMEDDIYKGYFIPAGTTVIANVWGISKNEKYFPEPDVFDPERYLNGKTDSVVDPRDFVFGFGRRKCPAALLAFQGIALAAANILWAFKITLKSEKPAGPPYDTTKLFNMEATSHALPFECTFEPRWPSVPEHVKHAVGEV